MRTADLAFLRRYLPDYFHGTMLEENMLEAIRAAQREAIEAAAKAAADTIRGCDDPDRRTVAHRTTKAILALIPAPAREGE